MNSSLRKLERPPVGSRWASPDGTVIVIEPEHDDRDMVATIIALGRRLGERAYVNRGSFGTRFQAVA